MTAQELTVAALHARVRIAGDRIVMFQEVERPTKDTLTALFDRVDVLTSEWDRFGMIIDLTGAGRPNAQVRAALKERFEVLRGRLVHVAVFTETNVVLRTAAKFVLMTVIPSVSIHRTEAEARKAILECL